jgi:hypothetical protein
MSGLLKFEYKRIFYDRKNIAFFIIFLVVSLYFVESGVKEFERFQKDKEVFVKSEREKIPKYINYKQYSGYGFRVLLDPLPLSIFYKNSTALGTLEGNVDNTQILKIFNAFKGKRLFYFRGHYKDYSGFIFFVGSLLMIYMGVMAIRSLQWLKFSLQFISPAQLFFRSTLIRLMFLNLFFIVVMGAVLAYARVKGIVLSELELQHFSYYGLFQLLLLDFFYLSGLLLSAVLKFRKTAFIGMFLVWLFFTFLLPELNRLYLFQGTQSLPFNETLDIEKLEHLMEFEEGVDKTFKGVKEDDVEKRKELHNKAINEFLNTYQASNRSKEAQMTLKIQKTIYTFEKQTVLFPTLFYSLLAAEVSSKGYYVFIDFKDYLLELQAGFSRFYFDRQYIQRKQEIESFVKGDENIFKAKTYLPRTYWWSVSVTFFYCLIFLGLSYILVLRRVYPYD